MGDRPQAAVVVVHQTNAQCQSVSQTVTGRRLQLEVQVLEQKNKVGT